MTTVKELIEILQKLDPNTLIVKPGHSDCGESYDDIYMEDLVDCLTIKKYNDRSWSGKYGKVISSRDFNPSAGELKAYCI